MNTVYPYLFEVYFLKEQREGEKNKRSTVKERIKYNQVIED
ncbi:hypothetical protein [uncultured Sunxiuqinia sp.]|nr:hypothetical protein [uncultured Sunxiuqinia sp.]